MLLICRVQCHAQTLPLGGPLRTNDADPRFFSLKRPLQTEQPMVLLDVTTTILYGRYDAKQGEP